MDKIHIPEIVHKFYNHNDLVNSFINSGLAEKQYQLFVNRMELELFEMSKDNELTEGEIKEDALKYSIVFVNEYYQKISQGYHEAWCRYYADSRSKGEDEFQSLQEAYKKVRLQDKDISRSQLQLYCLKENKTDLYSQYFIFLMEQGIQFENAIEQARVYEKVYQEQVVLGRSEIFAHKFADYLSEGESQLYAFTFASVYEEALNQGKSERYAEVYADKLGEYVCNYYLSFEEALSDELFKKKALEIAAGIKSL